MSDINVTVQDEIVNIDIIDEPVLVNVVNSPGVPGAPGQGVPVGGTTGQVLKKLSNTNYDTYWAVDAGGISSIGLTMPSAFAVANSPLTANGTIAVTGAGTSAQYIRGDGQLANFPDNGGGGSAYNYYLNGSVNQGTFGGDVYYEMSKTPVLGAGTNFTRTNGQGNGYIASFITDAGDPSLLNIPGGNWNLEFYFQSSSTGGSPQFYAELYKVSSTNVFTLVASGSTNPEGIPNGTTVDQYFTSIPVPQTSLLVTDRLAIRIYVITSGRTITLHTENSNLCEILTTFSTGLNALNGLTAQVQYFATGTSGTDFGISSATDTHTFNLPTASSINRGALSSTDWTTFNGKQNALGYTAANAATTLTINGVTFDLSANRSWTVAGGISGSGASGQVAYWTGTSAQAGSNNLFWDAANGRLGIGTNAPAYLLEVLKNQNTQTSIAVTNTTIGTVASTAVKVFADNGRIDLLKNSSARTPYKILGANDGAIYNYSVTGNSDIAILNEDVTGNIKFGAGSASTAQMTLHNTGNLLLGSTTNSGERLQVTGTMKVTTSGMFGTNTQSSGVKLETDGVFRAWTSVELGQFGNATLNTSSFSKSTTGSDFFSFTNNSGMNAVAGTYYFLRANNNINPTSGTAVFNQFLIQGTINQQGGANGITRGLYVNPTLTAAADFRAIETTEGKVIFSSNILTYFTVTGANPNWTAINISNTSTNGRSWVIGAGATNGTVGNGNFFINDATSGATRLTLNSSGYLSIGGGTAGYPLSIAVTGVAVGALSSGGNLIATAHLGNGVYIGTQSTTNAIVFGMFSQQQSFIWAGWNGASIAERMRLTENANLLLGSTTDSGERLQVTGSTKLQGNVSTGANVTVGEATSNPGDLRFFNANVGVRRTAASGLDFRTGSSNVGLTIDSTQLIALGGSHAPTAKADISASTTSNASLRIRSGTAPTSPNDGDIWFDGTDIKMRIGGVTKTFTLI
jgi:hypothetical protein